VCRIFVKAIFASVVTPTVMPAPRAVLPATIMEGKTSIVPVRGPAPIFNGCGKFFNKYCPDHASRSHLRTVALVVKGVLTMLGATGVLKGSGPLLAFLMISDLKIKFPPSVYDQKI
jgi:hypothetical protein